MPGPHTKGRENRWGKRCSADHHRERPFTATTPRLTQRDYFTVALRLLAAGSHEALTTAALCDELQVSKGSFYHHFGGWPGFVTASRHR